MTTRIAVAALGHPEDGAVWSRTPMNVVQALIKEGATVQPIDALLSTTSRLDLFVRHAVQRVNAHGLQAVVTSFREVVSTEAKSDYNFSVAARRRRAHHVRSLGQQEGIRDILHMTSNSLPDGPIAGQRNYALIDSTWAQMGPTSDSWPRIGRQASEAIRRYEAAALRAADHVFTIGKHVRDHLLEDAGVHPSCVTAVGSGFNALDPAPTGTRLPNRLLFVAKQRFEEKGGKLALAAFSIARKERPDLQLVVLGDESYPARFSGVPGVTGKGHVSYDELKDLFARSTLLFMPAEREPWGLVYLEAMSARTPILMLDRMSGRELTRDGQVGYLISDPSPASVARFLIEALQDIGELERRAQAAYTHVRETYSWTSVARTILNQIKVDSK